MNLSALRSQIAALKAQVPPPKGRPSMMIFAQRFDPENPPGVDVISWEPDPTTGESRHPIPYDGRETPTHWPYRNAAELDALKERFEREYGPATRGPNDLPNFFIHLVDREEIAERDAIRFTTKAAAS